jgi:hypothetical protein
VSDPSVGVGDTGIDVLEGSSLLLPFEILDSLLATLVELLGATAPAELRHNQVRQATLEGGSDDP